MTAVEARAFSFPVAKACVFTLLVDLAAIFKLPFTAVFSSNPDILAVFSILTSLLFLPEATNTPTLSLVKSPANCVVSLSAVASNLLSALASILVLPLDFKVPLIFTVALLSVSA